MVREEQNPTYSRNCDPPGWTINLLAPKNNLTTYVAPWKEAGQASGFFILIEENQMLDLSKAACGWFSEDKYVLVPGSLV